MITAEVAKMLMIKSAETARPLKNTFSSIIGAESNFFRVLKKTGAVSLYPLSVKALTINE